MYNGYEDTQYAYIYDMKQIDNSFRLCIESNVGSDNLAIGTNFVFTEKTFKFNDNSNIKLWTPDNIYVEQNQAIASYRIPVSDFVATPLGYSVETLSPNRGVGRFYAETILTNGVFRDNLYDQQ